MVLKTLTVIAILVVLTVIQVSTEGNQDNVEQNIFLNKIVPQPESLIKSRTLRNANKLKKDKKGIKKAKKTRKEKKSKRNKVEKKKKTNTKKGRKNKGRKDVKEKNKNKRKKSKGNGRKVTKKKKKGKKGKGKRRNVMKKKKRGKGKGRKKGKRRKAKRNNEKKGKGKVKRKKGKKGKERKAKINNRKKGKGNKGKQKIKNKRPNKKKSRKSKNKKIERATTCDECVVKLANYAKLYVAQAKNRKQQILRMEKACETSKKKMGKKDVFNSPYSMMLDNAGGNKSDPKCKGKSIMTSRQSDNTDEGAASMADMNMLGVCNATIENKCKACQLDNATKKAEATACKNVMTKFIKAMDNCLNVTKYPTQEKLCGCVDEIDSDEKIEKHIRACKWVTQASLDEVAYKKNCVKEFAKCRKAEDKAVEHIHKCKLPMLKCGGVTTVAEANAHLPVLKDLKTELDATEAKVASALTGNGMDALNLTKDTQTPASLDPFKKDPDGSPSRQSSTGCRNLAKAGLKFNTSAIGTGEKANDKLDTTEASNTTDILKEIKARDISADLADCKTDTRAKNTLIELIRHFMAGMVLWRKNVVEVKIVVVSLVISNAAEEPSANTAASGASTAASGASTAAGGDTTSAGDTTAAGTVVTAKAQARKKRFLDAVHWLKQKVF